ncbi:MAG: iron-containing alcohol dehydrogenase [Chloroflexota bacterium]|nr:iron-containing alcohol dehydrogenase [Chloroflexota bacterium]
MNFEFATAARIVFGFGQHQHIGTWAAELGKRAMLVTGSQPDRAAKLVELINAAGVATATFAVAGEPTMDDARRGAQAARAFNADLVIGAGGGSVIDAAKAIAALTANGGDPLDYVEVIGKNQPLTKPSLPVIALPTTAGTGSEVTRNAVLSSPEHKLKVSMRSPSMLPRLALVDPMLMRTMPQSVTASSGIDALTQLIEPFVSNAATLLTDGICREGLPHTASLARAYHTGDPDARESMALASLFGGLALANAKLGAVHGIAGPLGGMFPVPHGVACGRLLPGTMAANLQAINSRDARNPAARRYAEIARILTGKDDAAAGVEYVRALVEELNLPRLRTYGVTPAAFDDIAEKSARASSMKGNPILLTHAEIVGILESAY